MEKIEKNTFELIIPIPIDIRTFQPVCNYVLLEYDPEHNDKTTGGIYVPKDGRNYAQNAIRLSKVIKLPKYLYFNQKEVLRSPTSKSMLWETEIEALPGDIALTNHMDSNSAYIYECEGKYYRTIKYGSIDALKRGKRIIPVNGNILVKPVEYEDRFGEFGVKRDRDNVFEICHVGKRNTAYGVPEYVQKDHDMDAGKTVVRRDFEDSLKLGDKIIITNKFLRLIRDLEHSVHAKFDEGRMYKICKRYMIAGILED